MTVQVGLRRSEVAARLCRRQGWQIDVGSRKLPVGLTKTGVAETLTIASPCGLPMPHKMKT